MECGGSGLRKHPVSPCFYNPPCYREQIVIPRQLIQLPFCTAADLWMGSYPLYPPRWYYCPSREEMKVTREFNSSPSQLANCRTLILLGKVILFAARGREKRHTRTHRRRPNSDYWVARINNNNGDGCWMKDKKKTERDGVKSRVEEIPRNWKTKYGGRFWCLLYQ